MLGLKSFYLELCAGHAGTKKFLPGALCRSCWDLSLLLRTKLTNKNICYMFLVTRQSWEKIGRIETAATMRNEDYFILMSAFHSRLVRIQEIPEIQLNAS